MTIKHICFDGDGVLWSGTNEGYIQCFHRAIAEVGVSLNLEKVHERAMLHWGKSAVHVIEGIIPEFPLLVDEAVERFHALLITDFFRDTAQPIPGVKDALAELHARGDLTLSLITGMISPNRTVICKRFGIEDYLDIAFSPTDSDDPKLQKTTGYHLKEIMRQEGLAPSEVVVVGDSGSDLVMAQNCNASFVAVLSGHFTREQALELGVADILESAAELPQWVRGREREREQSIVL